MTNLLIPDIDDIASRLTKFDIVECWQGAITADFKTRFAFMSRTHQIDPFSGSDKLLVKPSKEQVIREKSNQWVRYYQPSVSVAKRASTTPMLDPTSDCTAQGEAGSSIALLCSVVIPSARLLTPRQLRWLDLLLLPLVVLNSESNVVHLFRTEYVFLRRMNVFTSAHPVKVVSFPIIEQSSYTQRLFSKYNDQSILFPYFNEDISDSLTSDYMSCMMPDGFQQKSFPANSVYNTLASTYTGMIKRYERCHQLKAIVSAFMIANPDYAASPESINPFDIRFTHYDSLEVKKGTPKEISDAAEATKRLKVQMTMGMVGVYEVLLSKTLTEPVNPPIISDNKTHSLDNKPFESAVKPLIFFLSGIHSGMLPFEPISTSLIQVFSNQLHNETYQQLLYNTPNHLGFLNEVNKDDVLLPLYLKIKSNTEILNNQPQAITDLLSSYEPLDCIKTYNLV